MVSVLEDVTFATIALVVVAGLAAGWVDAVVGGGGLIQLPALLLVPGISPVQALATNKMGSIFGTTTSAVTYYRRAHPDLKTALPMAGVALAGSFGGAVLAASLPSSVFKPIIVAALVAVAVFTATKPTVGELTKLRHTGGRHYGTAAGIGLLIGFYDGLIGPGTGSFLIIAMVTLLGYNFLAASAKAKIVNMATNLGALAFFLPHGSLLWGLGLVLGFANMIGGYLGARMAVRQGSKFIRVVFLVVVGALIIKLGHDVWVENIRG
ncbi:MULTISPECIES: TSUP family transporter [unclassified Arthrobacter]|uniref:sulfite exporter TauE/SafE family protein n=1 Tax=unclassified Arthrobacter TaxID=235627 RepID=UPI0024DFFE42|nr:MULTISPECIES: TSUP family transporter [unclassified Arthrobacter]MCC9146258.1 TSUP family transporter [Arthrobacter sp. zg-Y919]MDK1277488.1 TSUP family transporter [Arthrobacter sp. zg.Y919]WIB03976.1 TSUP family transporter [Arthrobacter sp. zg-Y919]